MIPLSLAQVARIVGGRLHNTDGNTMVTAAVEFDSRKIVPGGLFVALPGNNVDGHDYAAAAVAAGAAGVLAAREVDAPAVIVPPASSAHARAMVLTGDADGSGAAVLAALAVLAHQVVTTLPDLTTVGVTGSSGKTSTKDLIAQLVTPMGRTVAPPESFNNELGYPLTVLRADEATQYLVLELSARGVGHIAELCRIAPPRIGVVLNVGSAHLGEFGTRQDIAKAKGELVESLPETAAGGVAILNADDPLVSAMDTRTKARVVCFGEDPRADFRAVDIAVDDQARASFRLLAPDGEALVTLGIHGAHQVSNALAAAAVASELGAPVAEIADRLSSAVRLSARRMDVTTRADGVTVINDSFNANPESMRAALKSLAAIAHADGSNPRRSWAVLGIMGELGESSTAAHDDIGRLAVRLDINRLVVVGEQARAMHQGAALEGSWGEESVLVSDAEAAIALLRAELRPGDVVLVKASKSAALWRVAEHIVLDGERAR